MKKLEGSLLMRIRFRSILLRFRDSPRIPPNIVWSRGWYGIADWSGDSNYIYPAFPTRYRVTSLNRLVGKKGIIWLRLGSDPPKPEYDNGSPGDVVLFAREVIGRLGGSVVLITTDGDRSVPSGLPDDVVEKILDDPNIVCWYTQNLDIPLPHPKLKSIPIGIDLHTRAENPASSVINKAIAFRRAVNNAKANVNKKYKIWSDVHLEPNLGGLEGIPRGILTFTRDELREGIKSGILDNQVDYPIGRLTQTEVWERYGLYRFVISLPGHGLDCHRTWEALAMGAIVITINSPIDELLKPYRVVFIERKDPNWWNSLGNSEWLHKANVRGSKGKQLELSWDHWRTVIRRQLDGS